MRIARLSSLAVLFASALGCPGGECSEQCIDGDADGVCGDCCPGRLCDCDDDDPLVFPGAIDAHVDDYDFDCDGTDLGGEGAPCARDRDCTDRCNADTDTCTAAIELCDGDDGDNDGHTGCADLDCESACGALIAKACAEATPVEAVSGTFAGAPVLFSSCAALPQRIHRFTPGAVGERGALSLSHTGVASVELRTSCDLPSGPGCLATEPDPVVVDGGVPLFAILGGQDAYTFSWSFTPAVCGDGVVTAPEGCDDFDTSGGDGCASCQLEPGFDVCTLALDTELGVTTATTAGGSSVIAGSCGGHEAPERLHRIVPPSGGTMQIGVQSEAPLTVYARSPDCSGAELACQQGASALLTLAVTAGEPIIVIVDGAEGPADYTLVAQLDGS